ncbi:hypothetical protein Leryth_011107 [Lithospermum erythrorhizon]|nr:hypothetical protein Leryth_011107 [Lithospermum erythrorhizon]
MEFRDGGGFSGGGGGAAASTSNLHFPAAEYSEEDGPALPFPSRHGGFDNHRHFSLSRDDEEFRRRFGGVDNYGGGGDLPRNDACSGIITFITFSCFVSMTLIFGIYGSEILKLGPHASMLIKPNPLFVEYVKVERLDGAASELMLYGFDGMPPLNVVTNWSENHKIILPGATHKEWVYFLNIGSKIDISYNVTSLFPSPVVLVIAEGNQGLTDWLEDPSSPNLTLLWSPIYGTGVIGQEIPKSASYYVAVGNLNSDVVEVEFQIRIKALLYETTNAYYKCTISLGSCVLKIPFTGGNSALLAFPNPKLGIVNNKSHVRLSYGPRWITYFGGIGGVIILISLAIRCSNKFWRNRQGESSPQENTEPLGAPLIPQKDDDVASLGSSYDSDSQDGDDPDGGPSAGSHQGHVASDQELDNNTRRLCAICFDAPRDSFFLPCGHCVSCYACGTKIAEVAGTCPVCRRRMKKVKRIYTV